MPLIAYKGAHGANDFPLHFAFFSYLERVGILDKYDFAIDGWHDRHYALMLLKRFPQLKLVETNNTPRKMLDWVHHTIGRGYRPLSYLDGRFDAVCEAPGGRITPQYCTQDIFRLYPRISRRAILFHSIEAAALSTPEVRTSVASCDLVVARTTRSAEHARHAGARRVVASSDVTFLEHPCIARNRQGTAVALRLPSADASKEYVARVRTIVTQFCGLRTPVDFVPVEEPFGTEMRLNGIGTYLQPHTGLYSGDCMYAPFHYRRDAIISSRLHTTLLALLHGNRRILQFHIEKGTNKIEEIAGDIGLRSLAINRQDDVTWERICEFLNSDEAIPEDEARSALQNAKEMAERGMDAFSDWLRQLH